MTFLALKRRDLTVHAARDDYGPDFSRTKTLSAQNPTNVYSMSE